jgi:hypothetical protein
MQRFPRLGRAVGALLLNAIGAAAAADNPALQWTAYTEPAEQAYTTEVPRGWLVTGTIARRAAIGPALYLRLLSPDRQAYMVLGDPSLTIFTTPSNAGPGVRAWQGQVVQPYVASIPFAQDYAMRTLSGLCGQLVVDGIKARPDLTNGPWAQSNANARHDAGEARFHCERNGMSMHGLVVVDDYIYPSNFGGSIWAVDLLAAYFGPPDRTSALETVMQHVLGAIKFNPQWVSMEQAKQNQVVNHINASTAATIQYSQASIAAANARMQSTLRQGEQFDRILTGRSPYTDSSGRHYDLDNTKTQWVDQSGHTMGTTGASPGPGWTQLQQVPPQ